MTLDEFVDKLAAEVDENYYDYDLQIGEATIHTIVVDHTKNKIILYPTLKAVSNG